MSKLILNNNVDITSLSINQQTDVYKKVGEIIENLDAQALDELSGGYSKDIDKIFDSLVDTTASVLNNRSTHLNSSSFGYLDKFTESVEEGLRCSSLNYFISSVLPEFILGWHNIEWGNLIQIHRLLCVLAARDHGKSYEFSFAYPIWQMYRYKTMDALGNKASRELRMAKEGMLVTNEFGLAANFLAMIKEEIEGNDILRERLYPGKREGWGNQRIRCKNDSFMYVKSAGSKIRGNHPTWIVMDDFLNESALYSQDQRDKFWQIYSSVIFPALSPGGQLLIVGTPFHQKDLYGTLKEKRQENPGVEMPKVLEYPGIFPDGTLLFPQRQTFDAIMQKRALLGSLGFSREILVTPISDGATIFPFKVLDKSKDRSLTLMRNIESCKGRYEKIAVGCDFAISGNIGADFSVFTIMGQTKRGEIHLLNIWRKSGVNYRTQVEMLKKINRDWRPDAFIMESNGFQTMFLDEVAEANLPAVGSVTTGYNKKNFKTGVPAMAILFENETIKYPYKTEKDKDVTDLCHSEFNSFTFTDKGTLESTDQHDDIPMSTWQCIKFFRFGVDYFDFSFM